MSKWAVYSACKTGAQQPFKWSTSVLWQVSHLCQRTVDVKNQSKIESMPSKMTQIYKYKKKTISGWNKAIYLLKYVIKWQQNILSLWFWCLEAMSAPPQHGGGQQCKKRSKSRVHQAPVCSKDSVSESFPARATSRNPPQKNCPPLVEEGDIIFYIILLVILDSQPWLWLVPCTCSNLFSRATR